MVWPISQGGGLVGNIPRVLPKDCHAVIEKGAWEIPAVFRFLEQKGPVETEEMYRVFNMGIGYVLIVDPQAVDSIVSFLEDAGERVTPVGRIVHGTGPVLVE